jgi:hypothetical protein
MQDALPRRTISKKAKRHIIGVAILFGKRKTRPHAYLCSNNPMTSIKIHRFAEEVHASPLSLCISGSLAIQLRHT